MKIKCPVCKYEWEYKGNLRRATCPSCGIKVVVEECPLE